MSEEKENLLSQSNLNLALGSDIVKREEPLVHFMNVEQG